MSGPKGTLGENPFLKRIIFRFEISCTDLRQNLIIYLYCSEARRATRGQSSAKILRILWLLCKNPIMGLGLERIRLFFSLHKNSLFTEIQSDLNSPLVSKLFRVSILVSFREFQFLESSGLGDSVASSLGIDVFDRFYAFWFVHKLRDYFI